MSQFPVRRFKINVLFVFLVFFVIYGNAVLSTMKMSRIYLPVSESVMIGQSRHFILWLINSAQDKGNK